MKRILLLSLFAIVLWSCNSDKANRLDLTFQTFFPDTYAESFAPGTQVTLTSTTDQFTQDATSDENGLVQFTDVVPGTYTINASLSLTANQAFELTGNAEDVTLSAQLLNQNLLNETDAAIPIRLRGAVVGNFVFKEVYYTGSKTPTGGNYFWDQFHEIYNNATDTLYADGLYIADVYGASGQINPNTTPTPFQDDQQHVYLNSVWRIPGSGTDYPIAPGESILIAQTGLNHQSDPNGNPGSPVNLGNADFETYNQRDDDRDIDNPNVTNMERVYFTGGFTWLVPVFGPAVVIFRTDDFDALEHVAVPDASPTFPPRIKLPVDLVIDAFEALRSETDGSFKRIPASLDAGFIHASGTYTNESARRVTERMIDGRRILRNTNNTGNDFEIIATPTPRSFD
ncbi:MAG: DUF4876 domain-containing protein [Balneolales bacterium]|nr:DUF4876 domain-containing protein [Balneolales bacterium]